MATTPDLHAQLVQKLLTDPEKLASAVADALTTAGATEEWEAETIERVLYALTGQGVKELLPHWVGSAGDDAALAYWREIADLRGIEHDGPEYVDDEEEEEEEED